MSAAHPQHRSGNGKSGSTDENLVSNWPQASAWRDMNARSAPFSISTSPTNNFVAASNTKPSSPPSAAAAAQSSDTLASSSRGDSSSFHQRFASPSSAGADGRSPSPTRRGPFSFGNEARERWSSIGQAQQTQQIQHQQNSSDPQKRGTTGKSAFANDPLFGYGDIWGTGAGGSGGAGGPPLQQRPAVDLEGSRHRGMGSISVDTMQNRFDTMNMSRQPDPYGDVRPTMNGGQAVRSSMQPEHAFNAAGGRSLSPRSMMFLQQQQLHAAQHMTAAAQQQGMPASGTQSNTTGGALDMPRNGEEITTVFIVGFPDDMSEREFANMFLFAKGFEASTLKIPTGGGPPLSGRSNDNASSGPGGPYNAVNMGGGGGGGGGPYETMQQAGNSGGGTSSAGTGSWDEQSTPFSAPLSAGGVGVPPGKIKQIIGFAKFRTRAEALEARDALNGRKIDAERGCVLKTEMAKKNLHTKQRPVLSSTDGQAPVPPPISQAGPPPGHVVQQQMQQAVPPPQHFFAGGGQQGGGQSGGYGSQQAFSTAQQQQIASQGPPYEHGQSAGFNAYQGHGGPAPQQHQFDPFFHPAGTQLGHTDVTSPPANNSDASQYRRAASRSFSNVVAQEPTSGGEKWTGRGPLDYFDNAGSGGGFGQAPPLPSQQQAAVSFAGGQMAANTLARGGANWNSVSSPPGLSTASSGTRPISFGEVHSQQIGTGGGAGGAPPGLHFAQAASRAAALSSQQQGSTREDFRRGESILAAKQSPSPTRATTANVAQPAEAPQIIAPIAVQGGENEGIPLVTSPPPSSSQQHSAAAMPTQRPHSRVSNRATSPPIHGGVNAAAARFGSMRIDSPMQNQRPFSPLFSKSPPPGGEHYRATSPGSPPISSPTSRSFSIDANPPGNTLFVGNLPASITAPPASTQLEDLLYKAFSAKNGFRQMSFRVKNSGPMSFIEFDDVGCAGRALGELNGDTLDGLVKGGLRLSFSKHPLFKGTTSATSSQHGGAQTPPVLSNGLQTHEQKAVHPLATVASIDMDAVSTLEERSFNRGWLEGNEHGKLHGLFEGRQLGTEKGFELWVELGTMEGVAKTWLRRLQSATSRKAQKQVQQLQALLLAISGVPMENDDKVDLGAEMERIRARYKSVCFSLNIKDTREDENANGQEATIKGRRVNTANLHF